MSSSKKSRAQVHSDVFCCKLCSSLNDLVYNFTLYKKLDRARKYINKEDKKKEKLR